MGHLTAVPRPAPGETNEYYAGYIDYVPDGDIVEILERQLGETLAPLERLDDDAARHRYAPGKWSVKEMVGHLSDTERVFAYRLLRMARGDATPLPGFEQDDFVAAARFDERGIGELIDEFRSVRAATLALLRGLTPDELARTGTASGFPFTARSIAWIIAGHELHHRGVLRDRYGVG